MQVIVKGRHTTVSDRLKELAVRKVQKVQRFFDRINSLEIEFFEEHNPRIANKHAVTVILTTKAHVLKAHATGPDAQSAVDAVVDKLEAQVKRLKGKMVRRGNRASTGRLSGLNGSGGRRAYSGNEPVESVDNPAQTEERDWPGRQRPTVSRTVRFAVEPMTPEEAILQMETLGHDFLPFVNAESEAVGVVYRRPDGSFGLMEPDWGAGAGSKG